MTEVFKKLMNYPRALLDLVSIRHLETVCLPIGMPRCAAQVIFCALTAHPNIVMCMRADALLVWLNNVNAYGEFYATKNFFFRILRKNKEIQADKKKSKRGANLYFIPNQWQGRFKHLSVIGDCSQHGNMEVLIEGKHQMLKVFEKNIKVPLKFIFFVRNPYDIISSQVIRSYSREEQKEILKEFVNRFIELCTMGEKLLDKVSPDQVFLWRLEDHIADPQQKLSELCSFLNVESTRGYLDDCAKIFYKKPSRSRYLIDWHDDYKAQVAAAIEQYDFLSGYSWDSQ